MQRSFPLGLSLLVGAAFFIIGTLYFLSNASVAYGDQSNFQLKTLSERTGGTVAMAVTYRDGADSSGGSDSSGGGSDSSSGGGDNGSSGGDASSPPGTCCDAPPVVPSCVITATKNTLTWYSTNAVSAYMNNGIGAVGVNGVLQVYPSVTTTYTLTVTGRGIPGAYQGPTATCSVTIVVVPPPTKPSCTLTVTPATIQQGEQATLAWTSQNAVSATLSGEAGAVALNGSFAVNPSVSTGYLLTVKNSAGVTAQCEANITVVPKNNPPPACWINASPATVQSGGTSSLSWSSTNATSASLSQGIGAVAVNGSKNVYPAATTVYTLTVNGAGGSATCSTTVTVQYSPPPSAPSCTITVTPSTIHEGEEATLAWTSQNAVTAVLTGGTGSVALNGSFAVHPASNNAYGITVTNAQGVSKYCETSITVIPKTSNLSCSISAYPTSVQAGGSTVLTWTSTGASSASLSGYGSVATNGNKSVVPNSSTSYVLTVVDGYGKQATCSAWVTVVQTTPRPIMNCYLPGEMRTYTAEEKAKLKNDLTQSFRNWIVYMNNAHGYSWDAYSEVAVDPN